MPKDDRPGPAFNAAASRNPALEPIMDRLDRDLAPALKMIEDLPALKDQRFYTLTQKPGLSAYAVSVFFSSDDERPWFRTRKELEAPRPEACFLVAREGGMISYRVTGYKLSALDGLKNIFGGRPKFRVLHTHDFAEARDAFRREIAQLCPQYQQEVERAFKSLTAILLFKPLKLKTAAVNPVRA